MTFLSVAWMTWMSVVVILLAVIMGRGEGRPPVQEGGQEKLLRNFCSLNKNRNLDELERVKGLLTQHKQRIASKLPGIELSPNTVVEEQQDPASPDSSDGAVGDEEESSGGFIRKRSPEILHLNRELSDYLYQGDIALTAEQAASFLSASEPSSVGLGAASSGKGRRKRQALNPANFGNFKWSNGTVPYTFDASIEPPTRALIRQAMDFWESQTCISFVEVPSSSNGQEASGQRSKLQIFKGDGCWSYVGKIYVWESQEVSIGDGCEHFGVITHELAHALGFFHAQSRHDRDKYVTFNAQNVQGGFEDQFGKESENTNANYEVAYDWGSVMHYSEIAFAKDESKPVLLATEPHNQNTMGQRIRPSFSDVLVMNKYYQCADRCSSHPPPGCLNGGYQSPRDCSTCVCPWGFSGPTCADRSPGTNNSASCGATLTASDEWQELSGIIGEAGSMELKPKFDTCYWHLSAAQSRRVEIKVLQAGRVCSAGCFYGNVEFKLAADFGRTGMRMCCARDVKDKPALKSEGNLAVVGLYSRLFTQQFKIQYRQI